MKGIFFFGNIKNKGRNKGHGENYSHLKFQLTIFGILNLSLFPGIECVLKRLNVFKKTKTYIEWKSPI